MNRSQEYDLYMLRELYAEGDLALTELEYRADHILRHGLYHEHDWIDITTFGRPVRETTCAKCGQRKNN